MKKKIFYLVSIILIILIPTLLTEIYLKNIGLGNPITYDKNDVYGYSPKPNQKKVRFNNATVTINDVGLRSIYDWKNNDGGKKIIFFGDSVTYGGSYIDDKETFAHLSCKNLNNPGFICGNAGVNAYGVLNITFRSRYDLRLSDDDLRIFLLVPDDFYRGLQNYNTAHFYMNDNKYLFPGIIEALNFFSTKYNLKNFISKKVDNNYKKINTKNLIDESILIFNSEIQRLKKQNKKFLLFYSPSKNENALNNYIYNKLYKLINHEIIDLSDYLDDEMYEDSVHYNKIGHKTISKIISKKINEKLK